MTPTLKPSSDTTSPTSLSIQISETTIQKGENLIVSGEDSPVPTQAVPETEKDLKEKLAASGGNNSESSEPSDQYSVSLSSLPELSTEDYEQFLGDSEWQAIKAKLKSSRRRSLVRDTADQDYLLFPTLTSNSGGKSRPAGQNKLEQWFKQKNLILAGSGVKQSGDDSNYGLSVHLVRGDVSTGAIPREHFSTPTNTEGRIRARYLLGRSVTPAQAAVALQRVIYLNKLRG